MLSNCLFAPRAVRSAGHSARSMRPTHRKSPTTNRICQLLDKVRPHKKVFSADILGLPDDTHHPLSVLTMIIVARKIMGMGTKNLLAYQGWLKQKQAALITNGYIYLDDRERESPIEEGELLEVLQSG